MTDHLTPRRTPRLLRTTYVASVVLAATVAASPAMAGPPDTWEDTSNPSTASVFLTLGGWVLGIIVVLTLLTYLPSMVRRSTGGAALTFTDKSEWFGGPRTGVDQDAEQPQGTGGASARW